MRQWHQLKHARGGVTPRGRGTGGGAAPRRHTEVGGSFGNQSMHLLKLRASVGKHLVELGATPLEQSLVQAVRQVARRPLKVDGLLYFVDDVLNLSKARRSRDIVLTSSRARRLGVLLHPEEVFEEKTRIYPHEETK